MARIPTFYKLVDSRMAAQAIVSGALKFATVDELNDPCELVPLMNREAVRSSLGALRREGYTQEQFQWLGHQEAVLRLLSPETRVLDRPSTRSQANRTLALPVYDDMDYMERQLLETIRLIRSRVGILCLTDRVDSLPMWAFYGARAGGYAIQLDGLDAEFPGDATGSLNIPKPVKYVEDLVGLTHDPTTQDSLFFCKFSDWSYEREWRIVTALSQCQRSAARNLYIRRVSPKIVSRVICGWRVPAEEIRALRDFIQQTHAGVRLMVAALEKGRISVPP